MLKTRFITAVIALIIFGAVLFVLPSAAAKSVIALLIIAGAWEWSAFLGLSANTARYFFVALIGALMAGVVFVVPAWSELILQIACVWWGVAFIWTFFFPTPIPLAIRWLAGALILVPLFIALLLLYSISPQMMLFALLIVWVADMGAYFAGIPHDLVVSPAMGGILIGHEVARALGRRFVFTERKDGEMMIRRGFALEKGEKVIIAEDVVTRGTSLLEVIKVVEDAGGQVVGLTSIIDRTSGEVELPLPLNALAKVVVQTWQADGCPLCAEGQELVKPGSRGN